MGAVVTLALKDLKVLTRTKIALFWIFFFPLLLALFFGSIFGGGGGSRALSVGIVDEDQTAGSKALIERLSKSEALKVEPMSREQAAEKVRTGKLVAYIVVPKEYGEKAGRFGPSAPALEVGIDPSRKAERGYLEGVLTQALFSGVQDIFQSPEQAKTWSAQQIQALEMAAEMPAGTKEALKRFLGEFTRFMEQVGAMPKGQGSPFQPAKLEIKEVTREGSEPKSSYEVTFPSSILWGILGSVQSFVISIVTERVGGTFLRLKVAPLSWGQVLGGKALACFITCCGVSVVLLLFGALVFKVRLDHPIQLAMAIVSTSFCFVGILMFLCTLGKTVDGVAGMAWGILMPLAMIGGGMVPLMVMPEWMLRLSDFSPVKWGIWSLEGAIWRDFGIVEMLKPCGILLAIGLVGFAAGVKKLSWGEG